PAEGQTWARLIRRAVAVEDADAGIAVVPVEASVVAREDAVREAVRRVVDQRDRLRVVLERLDPEIGPEELHVRVAGDLVHVVRQHVERAGAERAAGQARARNDGIRAGRLGGTHRALELVAPRLVRERAGERPW